MPRSSVRIAESALEDLRDIKDWYSKQGVPETGTRLLHEILTRIERLAEHPEMGRIVPEFGQDTLRELIHPPFRIVYRREESIVRIVRVWRSERLLRLPAADEP